ncbi:MAG: STAS/SEC14 domain-containing protein [Planctomycetota bacterium]
MAVTLMEAEDAPILEVRVRGKLTAEDYERFIPEIERLIQEHGKLRILFEMRDFHGWDAAALWEDIKFDVKHFNDIERLALVGEKRWQKGMSVFCKPFTTAEIRYYELDELERARQWLRSDEE